MFSLKKLSIPLFLILFTLFPSQQSTIFNSSEDRGFAGDDGLNTENVFQEAAPQPPPPPGDGGGGTTGPGETVPIDQYHYVLFVLGAALIILCIGKQNLEFKKTNKVDY